MHGRRQPRIELGGGQSEGQFRDRNRAPELIPTVPVHALALRESGGQHSPQLCSSRPLPPFAAPYSRTFLHVVILSARARFLVLARGRASNWGSSAGAPRLEAWPLMCAVSGRLDQIHAVL
jgi:hypothetical protein